MDGDQLEEVDEFENHVPDDVDAKELEKVKEGKRLRVKQDYSQIQVGLLSVLECFSL